MANFGFEALEMDCDRLFDLRKRALDASWPRAESREGREDAGDRTHAERRTSVSRSVRDNREGDK